MLPTGSWSFRSSRPVVTSQSRTVPSVAPDRARRPSGENATTETLSACPSNLRISPTFGAAGTAGLGEGVATFAGVTATAAPGPGAGAARTGGEVLATVAGPGGVLGGTGKTGPRPAPPPPADGNRNHTTRAVTTSTPAPVRAQRKYRRNRCCSLRAGPAGDGLTSCPVRSNATGRIRAGSRPVEGGDTGAACPAAGICSR